MARAEAGRWTAHRRPVGERAATLLGRDTGVDGRYLMVGAVAAYLTAVWAFAALWGVDLWRWLGVPSGPFLFFDTHNLTAAGECLQSGLDPFLANPCDFHGRPWNYPRVWLSLGRLGMDLSWTFWLGAASVLGFLTAIYFLVGRLTAGQGVVLAAALCSPAVMFAVEHGQADLIVFTLVVGAVLLWRAGRPILRAASPLLVLLAAVLKLFPLVGLGAYILAGRRKAALVAAGGVAGFAVYALVTLEDLSAIAARAPQGEYHSYGGRILLARLYQVLLGERWAGGPLAKQLLVVAAVSLGIAVFWLLWRNRRRVPWQDPAEVVEWRLLSFQLGALVYLGSFTVANNWDYRLIFLLLALPQLFAWIGSTGLGRRAPAAVGLVIVLGQLYIGALFGYWTLHREEVDWSSVPLWSLGDELVSWALAAVLFVLLMPSLRAAFRRWTTPSNRRSLGVSA